ALPPVRRASLGGGDEILLADTVGFVRDLPHELVAAFRATLTETRDAGLMLHVIDASDPHHPDRIHQVETVLDQIGAGDVPCIRVYNKIDVATEDARRALRDEPDRRVAVSAVTGEGLPTLIDRVRTHLMGGRVAGRLTLGPDQSRLRAKLFDLQAVRNEQPEPSGGWTIDVELTARRWQELARSEDLHGVDVRRMA